MKLAIEQVEAVHPVVARALRSLSGLERLRLAHEEWEMARDRIGLYLAARHPDWSQQEIRQEVALLRHLVDALEALGAEYMIGGSQAAIYYGEPRWPATSTSS